MFTTKAYEIPIFRQFFPSFCSDINIADGLIKVHGFPIFVDLLDYKTRTFYKNEYNSKASS
ncbi:hypothetical protein C21_03747 [Arenibacter sp. NBRC 103722]|nr:hypothetical protein [Arenibacter sp. A80]RFT55242.1 hypothetical protein D0S24_14575 [Arenibacter sp. P308M17]GBF21561.1 hypothetical protein C21_03747 [Arenibacter sp. NBRC 103722]HCO83023.1 hypothetical protein [Arenibacter sp.]